MSKKAIILLIVLAGLIAAAFIIYSSLADDVVPAAPDTGSDDTVKNEDEDLAEDFTVHDLDGNEVSLSDMRGRPVIVNFFATWCGPCMSEMPHLEKVYDDVKASDLGTTRVQQSVAPTDNDGIDDVVIRIEVTL